MSIICISGSGNTGKSTLLGAFLQKWSNYATPTITYRDVIKSLNLPHSRLTTKKTQLAILCKSISDLETYPRDAKVIFDRCPLDVLVYSMWANLQEGSDVDDAFIQEIIPIVKESMKKIDIIFFIPLTDYAPIDIVDDGFRDTDEKYIHEIDNIFKALYQDYLINADNSIYFPKNDSPAIIEIYGSTQERLGMIADYINPTGEVITEETSILSADNLNNLEALLKDQGMQLDVENAQKKIYSKQTEQLK